MTNHLSVPLKQKGNCRKLRAASVELCTSSGFVVRHLIGTSVVLKYRISSLAWRLELIPGFAEFSKSAMFE
jgi:hypothetical protein